MSFDLYLERYGWLIDYTPNLDINHSYEYIVVIPAYQEPHISKALHALQQCEAPQGRVLILLVLNAAEDAEAAVHQLHQETQLQLDKDHQGPFTLRILNVQLPPKKAGVGLARKIGMDTAIRIFQSQQHDGVLICYDADSLCDKNYLQAIESYYKQPNNLLGLVYYEHPLGQENQQAIVNYELFLRYYIQALRFCQFPYAWHTLGSCITVKASAYCKQGGMNTRKAGEDFYFIHKMVTLGGIGEINETKVIPSARISDRVPFGTGHDLGKQVASDMALYTTYSPRTFEEIQLFWSQIDQLYVKSWADLDVPAGIMQFCEQQQFGLALEKIRKQANNLSNFRKNFFTWWDGFRVLKCIHFYRDHIYPNVALEEAVNWITLTYLHLDTDELNLEEKLYQLRLYERSHPL